ncbi:hypothetical protein F5J12DRAFT_88921 [Pisolithus orientalis]|uniref:uncharacterized protein n=1 Tax=Pisolithus orientalis TaxID=936130 RepID=UPI002224DDF9|nr:uncharacterized protein F5J12DRAFT_88921 [Pisolithus orientalis]KAI6007726.1 hypothetical protein F5J12DRAFT_88921 [Pisolithus orientalis]
MYFLALLPIAICPTSSSIRRRRRCSRTKCDHTALFSHTAGRRHQLSVGCQSNQVVASYCRTPTHYPPPSTRCPNSQKS